MRGAVVLAALVAICGIASIAQAKVLPVKAGTMSDPCETLTKIRGCIECRAGRGKQSPAGATYRCLYCNKDRAQDWSTDTYNDPTLGTNVPYIKSCPAAVINSATCSRDTGIANCWGCWTTAPGPWWSPKKGGKWCTLCNLGYYFDWNINSKTFGQCLKGECPQYTRNPTCSQCITSDKLCTACKQTPGKPKLFLMPKNALWTNGNYGESMCLTYSQIVTYSKQVNNGNLPPAWPGNCTQIGTDMQCMRCVDGYALSTPSTCVPFKNVGCTVNMAYKQYCAKCVKGDPGQCQTCVYARGLNKDNKCSNDCKLLWGIGCATCDRTRCTGIDSFYAKGRR